MDVSEDSFRALARSSPWRWSALHFTHTDEDRSVEAWLRRPGELRVRTADGREHHEPAAPSSRAWASTDPDFVPPEPLAPLDVDPVLRADGLVAVRPDDLAIEYGDPMYENYRWVALLDPVELSHHVEVSEVGVEERHGRPVWRARLRAQPGYDPTCGCCPLLWSEVSDRDEYGDGDPGWSPPPRTSYPWAYDVALDAGTGVVVALAPVGGVRRDLWFDVTIHEVGLR